MNFSTFPKNLQTQTIPDHSDNNDASGTRESIRREFIKGSAIAPDVFAPAVRIVSDLETDLVIPEVIGTPIDDELGVRYTRFGHKAKVNRLAAAFVSESGETWQLKIFGEDADGRSGQYLAPKGIGDKPYFPPVPYRIVLAIALKYDLKPPGYDESFWLWLINHPVIPIVITEGGKKALALISMGIPAIALYGCRCGAKREDSTGRGVPLYLIPELAPYVTGRKIIIAFDRDTNPKAKSAVAKGIYSLSIVIQKSGGSPHIATWDTQAGKGIDDVIARCGSSFATGLIESAPSFETWKTRKVTDLGDLVNRRINVPFLTLEALAIPETPQLINIKGRWGQGKTQVVVDYIRSLPDTVPVYPIPHRVTLSRELSDRLRISYRTERTEESAYFGYGLCIDSLHPGANPPVNPDDPKFHGAIIVLDEIVQVILHLLTSDTLNHIRPLVIETLKKLLRNVIRTGGKIFLLDADLSPVAINFIKGLIGNDLEYETYTVENTYQREEKRPLYVFEKPEENFSALTKLVNEGKKLYVTTGSQKSDANWGTINLEKELLKKFPSLRILRIDRETIDDPSQPAYKCTTVYRDSEGNIIQNLALLVRLYDVVIVSPTLETGVSIVTDHFDAVFGFFSGTQTVDGCCQSLARVRADIPRYIYAPKHQTIGMVGNGSPIPDELARSTVRKAKFALRQLDEKEIIRLTQLHEIDAISAYDDENPICLKTWSEYGAIINSQARNYRESIEGKLLSEGYEKATIEAKITEEESALIKESIKETREESWQAECQAIAETPNPTDSEYQALSKKIGGRKKEDLRKLKKGTLCRRYLTEEITPEIVDRDNEGWYGKIALHYFLTEGKSFVQARDREKLISLAKMNTGKAFSPDISATAIGPKVACLKVLEIHRFLDTAETLTNGTLDDWLSSRVLPYRRDIKTFLGVTIGENSTPITACQRILSTIGLKLICIERKGKRGDRSRVYRLESLDPDGRAEVFRRWLDRDSKMYHIDTVSTENVIYTDHPSHDPVDTDQSVATENVIDIDPPSPDLVATDTDRPVTTKTITPFPDGYGYTPGERVRVYESGVTWCGFTVLYQYKENGRDYVAVRGDDGTERRAMLHHVTIDTDDDREAG